MDAALIGIATAPPVVVPVAVPVVAHKAVSASPTTLRAARARSLVEPADASLAVIVILYTFRCGGLAPLVSRRLLPAHSVFFNWPTLLES